MCVPVTSNAHYTVGVKSDGPSPANRRLVDRHGGWWSDSWPEGVADVVTKVATQATGASRVGWQRPNGSPFGRRLAERTVEQVGDAENRSAVTQVFSVQPRALNADDRRDVAPLSVGHRAPQAIPAQLLEEDVLGRVYVQAPPVAEIDRHPAGQLASIEGRAASDEQVHLQLRGPVNQVGARPRPDGATERLGIDIELRRERRHQGVNVPLLEGDDDVDINRGTGFACEGAGDRAPMVRNVQSVQLASYRKRRLNQIDARRHQEITAAASG